MNPEQFTAWPNTTYHTEITIKSSSQILPGKYLIDFQHCLDGEGTGDTLINIIVTPLKLLSRYVHPDGVFLSCSQVLLLKENFSPMDFFQINLEYPFALSPLYM